MGQVYGCPADAPLFLETTNNNKNNSTEKDEKLVMTKLQIGICKPTLLRLFVRLWVVGSPVFPNGKIQPKVLERRKQG